MKEEGKEGGQEGGRKRRRRQVGGGRKRGLVPPGSPMSSLHPDFTVDPSLGQSLGRSSLTEDVSDFPGRSLTREWIQSDNCNLIFVSFSPFGKHKLTL